MQDYFISVRGKDDVKMYVHFDPRTSSYRVSDTETGAAVFTLANATRFIQEILQNSSRCSVEKVQGAVKRVGEEEYRETALRLAKATFEDFDKEE